MINIIILCREETESNKQTRKTVQTFRINGDNMDYSTRPRHQPSDSVNETKHFFQSYAVKDCIDFSHLSTQPPDISALTKEELCESMLPSTDDDQFLLQNFKFLLAHVLCDNIPYFSTVTMVLLNAISSTLTTVKCHQNQKWYVKKNNLLFTQ